MSVFQLLKQKMQSCKQLKSNHASVMVLDSLSEPPVTAEMRSWVRGTEGPWSQSLCSSVQFSSGTQSCPTLWDPVDRSMPGLPVLHQLLQSEVPFPSSALGSHGVSQNPPSCQTRAWASAFDRALSEGGVCSQELGNGILLQTEEAHLRLPQDHAPPQLWSPHLFSLLLHSSLRLSLLAPGSLPFLTLFQSPSSFFLSSRFHSFHTHSLSTYYVPGPL